MSRFAGMLRAEARAFVAQARLLVDLQAAATAADPVFGDAVWAAEAALAAGISEGSVAARWTRAQRLLSAPALCAALESGLITPPRPPPP